MKQTPIRESGCCRLTFKVSENSIVTYLVFYIPTPAMLSETLCPPFYFAKRTTECAELLLDSNWSRTGLDIQGETFEGGSSRDGLGWINSKRAQPNIPVCDCQATKKPGTSRSPPSGVLGPLRLKPIARQSACHAPCLLLPGSLPAAAELELLNETTRENLEIPNEVGMLLSALCILTT